jgi:hypothetical protein
LGTNSNADLQIYCNKGADQRGVLIGTTSNVSANGKLHVVGSPFTNGIYVSNTGTSSNGILIENTGTTSSGLKSGATGVGTWGIATGNPQTGYSANGARGEVSNSNTGTLYTNGNAGVYGNVIASGSGALNMGVIGLAMLSNSSGSNLGVYARANNGANNYGIYAEVQGGSTGGTVENYAGKFAGDISMAGSGYATGTWVDGSDSTIKNDIVEIQNPLDALGKLKGYEYTFDAEGFPSLNLPEGKHYGLLAQEVEVQFPNAVKQMNFPAKVDSAGNIINDAVKIKGIEYNSVTAILVESVNQLNLKVQELQSQLDGCCGGQMRLQDQGNNPVQQVSIVSESVALLGDCVPNPNDGKTKITVRIPHIVANAEIIFTDQLGKEISRIAISNRGYSDLEIETAGLENGVYHYSLVVDGKLIDTKQMLKQH